MTVTLRVRSVVWFVLGVVVAALVGSALAAGSAGAAPGDTDATFVPTAPCRLFDFRPGAEPADGKKTPLAAGEANVHTQQVTGNVGDCVVPPEAVSVSMNVTIAGPTARSHLRVFPADEATPNASSLNWLPGQAPTPNKVDVKLSPDGKFKLFNFDGTVNVLADVVGYYTDSSLTEIDQRLLALQGRVDALEAKLADVTVEQIDGHKTVRFTDVNVQIVDGTGDTEGTPNGRGNLIVGYNDDTDLGLDEARTGSHNLVLGVDNDYTAYAGIVAGENNTVATGFATVTGGRFNVASGEASSVSGGFANSASGFASSVSGGSFNDASGGSSSVSGGRSGIASGGVSAVSGGEANTAIGLASSVSGGAVNSATGTGSTVSGGELNTATSDYASVGGGFSNEASGPRAVVSGGADNIASGSKSTVSGGNTRTSNSTFDWRAGSLFEDG